MNAVEELLKTRTPPKWFSRQAGRDGLPSKELYRKVYNHSVKEDIGWLEPVGKWMIPCNCSIEDDMGLTELDKVWKVATDLYDEGVFIKVTCYTAAYTPNKEGVVYKAKLVHCYLENYEDVESIFLSASKLRKRCGDYPHPLYFKTHQIREDNTQVVILRYMCCVEGDLYKNEDKTWKIMQISNLGQ